MTTNNIITWAACIVLAWAAVYLFSRLFTRHEKKSWVFIIIAVLEFILAIIFAFAAVAINTWRIWHFNMAMMALYAVLMSFAIANIIYFIVCLIRKGKIKDGGIKVKSHIAAIVTLVVCVLGTLNMQVVVPNTHTLYSDKVTEDHCFIVISDLHAGCSQPEKVIDRMLAKVAEQGPDFIVLNGDITDELTDKETMEDLYRKIGRLGIPAYFVFGNHDRQENAALAFGQQYTVDELTSAITGSGIHILKDEVITIGELSLLGREDASSQSRLAVEDLPPRDEKKYQITFDHHPYETEDIITTGADLQVSGHSHAGQYFPLETLYNLAGFDAYGEYQYGDTTLWTSSGASGWSVPFRTSRRCNYDVFRIIGY